jgi:hypothetical protein
MLRAILFLTLALSMSCKMQKEPTSGTSGYVTEGNSALWKVKEIPVCFENVTQEIFGMGWVAPFTHQTQNPNFDSDSDNEQNHFPDEQNNVPGDQNNNPDDQNINPNNVETIAAATPTQTNPSGSHGQMQSVPMPSINEIKEYRRQVKAVIEREFNSKTQLKFVGFVQCKPDSKGIRIALTFSEARVEAFGRFVDGMPNGVKLPFNPKDRAGDVCETTERRLLCLQGYALHEFGHAIGLRHEANRPDSSCPRDQTGGAGEDGAILVGKYDKRSIMNYCWNEAQMVAEIKPQLSPGDLATIKKYYSKKVEFPKIDKAVACQKQGHTWRSTEHCCVATRFENLQIEKQAFKFCPSNQLSCITDKGKWTPGKGCCENPAAMSQDRIYSTCKEFEEMLKKHSINQNENTTHPDQNTDPNTNVESDPINTILMGR